MTIIYLCPDQVSSYINISKTQNSNNGIYYFITYYEKFERKTCSGCFIDDELASKLDTIEKVKNSLTTMLSIDTNDLTEDIIRRFRYVEPVIEYAYQDVEIDPYILGLWLGDGTSASTCLTNIDIPILIAWKQYAAKIGCVITECNIKIRKTEVQEGEIAYTAGYNIVNPSGRNKLRADLQYYKLMNNKHIPEVYKKNTRENRLLLLAGLIDTDGSLSRNTYEIIQKSKKLSDDIVELARSLGFYTRTTESRKSCTYKGEKREGLYYRMTIHINQFSLDVPVVLDRKKFDKSKVTQWYNPFIDINGNVLDKSRTNWTEDMKIRLYSITRKIEQLMPNCNIPWKRYSELDETFRDISTGALLAMYRKTLLEQSEKYDALKLEVNFKLHDLFEPEWLAKYNAIKNIHEQGQALTLINNKQLYVWLYMLHNRNRKIPEQREMLEHLIARNKEINTTK